ncbi:alpha/beta fold hydrolase [Aquincola sp. MAHUQ-54]|uniref:Alpha/beta fold hydrolase n=1 Tax=Aquincola agrisoli TaxID=3119538 RepID=A0AAW9Q098_9BURK
MPTIDESIAIPVDEGSIAGTFVTPGTLLPGVLFIHGWGGSQGQYLARARQIAALGCICLTFDLRGHAQTRPQFETVSRASNLRDVLAAYDRLAERRHVDRSSIAVVGSSYGGYLATILTTMRPVKWLALRAPALYMDSGWEVPKLQLHKDQDLRAYRRSLVAFGDNRALQACHDFDGDLLLVESELDTIVPRAVLTSYREAGKNARSLTYRCLAGADHGLAREADQRAYTSVLVGWLQEMVFGERANALAPVVQEAPHEPEAPPTPAAPQPAART